MISQKLTSAMLTAIALMSTASLAAAAPVPVENVDPVTRFQKHCEAIKNGTSRDHFLIRGPMKMGEKFGEKMMARFEEAGLDTSKLKEYLSVLEEKTDALKPIRESTVQAVKKTIQRPLIDCNSSPEEVKAALEKFHSEVKKPVRAVRHMRKELTEEMRKEMENVRTYMKETVRPEVESLREQLKSLE